MVILYTYKDGVYYNLNNISLEEIQKSNLIIKAISSYYTSRSVGQRNLQISLLVYLIAFLG